jgi:soluble lytic murein transglycosylase-like protein
MSRQLPAQPVAAALDAAAAATHVDVALLRAVAWVESRFNPLAIGPKVKAGWQAKGLMQLGPDALIGVTDPFDPTENALAGAKLLASYLQQFHSDVKRALAAYNWGPSHVTSTQTQPTEVSTYVARVLDRLLVEQQPAGVPPPIPIMPNVAARARDLAPYVTCPECKKRFQVQT